MQIDWHSEESNETFRHTGNHNLEHIVKMAKSDICALSTGKDIRKVRLHVTYKLCEETADELLSESTRDTPSIRRDLAYIYGYLGRLAHGIYNKDEEIEWARNWNRHLHLALTTIGDDDTKFTMFRSKDIGWSAKVLYFADGKKQEMLKEWFDMHRQAGRMLNAYIPEEKKTENGLVILNAVVWQSSALASKILYDNTGVKQWKKKCEECCMRSKEATNYLTPPKRREIIDKLRQYLSEIRSEEIMRLFV